MNNFQPIELQTANTEAEDALEIVQTAFGGTQQSNPRNLRGNWSVYIFKLC
jgi:hypothetical protein